MKLQIKDAGDWRHLCEFDYKQKAAVMNAAAFLLGAMAPTATAMRVVDGDVLVSRCDITTSYTWRPA